MKLLHIQLKNYRYLFIIVCYLNLREKLESKRRKSSSLVSDCFISFFLWHSWGAQLDLDGRVREVRRQTAHHSCLSNFGPEPVITLGAGFFTHRVKDLVKLKFPSSFHVSKVTLSLFYAQLVETFLHHWMCISYWLEHFN